jgi:hypothetical protein
MSGSVPSARQAGNREFQRAQAIDGLTMSERAWHLQEAVKLYNQALQGATVAGEWFSARKNLSMAHKVWAELLVADTAHDDRIGPRMTRDQESIMFHFCEALQEVKEVLQRGPQTVASVMGPEWVQHLTDRATDTYLCFVDWSRDRSASLQTGLCLLRRIYSRLPTQELCVQCLYDEAEETFKACTREDPSSGQRAIGGFKEVLSQLPGCQKPLREASAGAAKVGDYAKMGACETLMESVEFEICVAYASQSILFGDEVLHRAMREFESLNMSGVWDAVDHYHEAIRQAREKDIEREAHANSRLGVLYLDVLKFKTAAKEYFARCMDLAASLTPRNLHGIEWYDSAAAKYQVLQSENTRRLDEEANAAKKPFLDALASELAALEEANKDTAALLAHIYDKHPPRKGGSRDTAAELKKQVLRAISHYHPDKNSAPLGERVDEAGKWSVLCEEICKLLNSTWDHSFKRESPHEPQVESEEKEEKDDDDDDDDEEEDEDMDEDDD